MSKMSIEWHEKCLKIVEQYMIKLRDEYIEAEQRYKKCKTDTERYRKQIERAKKLGKDGFDSERFKDE